MWNPFKKITYASPINGDITIGKQNNEKAIFAGGVTQSGGELVVMWDTVIGNLYKQHVGVNKFLLLGVGAGMILRIVKKYYPKAEMTGIDIDPIMKQIAIEQFGWEDTKRQKIIIADAIDWLTHDASQNYFDLIAVDVFIGSRNAPHTRTKIFLENIQKTMTKNGFLLYNADYHEKRKNEYKNFRKITDTSFGNVTQAFAYPLNRLLLLQNGH